MDTASELTAKTVAATLPLSPADRSVVILQSLISLLREKNILSRADIEDLCEKIQVRAGQHEQDPLPCHNEEAAHAASIISNLSDYLGRQYGGKHRRC